MDMKHGNEAWTCNTDMILRHGHMLYVHRNAAWKRSSDIQLIHVTQDMQHVHVAHTCSMEKQHASETFSMDTSQAARR